MIGPCSSIASDVRDRETDKEMRPHVKVTGAVSAQKPSTDSHEL